VQEPTEVKPPTPAPSRAESRFTPGAMLADRFRIVALLGKGGMGEVYRAEDAKLGQQVALKFLPVNVANDPAKLARLYSEVRLGRQVSHPNVCRVYDVMESEGHHFISMEYIDGEDLASLLRRIGKLPQEKAIDVARDICAGLAAAHSLGIIHRDLKPANVMIDGRGTARITDFGLAALAGETARGEIAGTPAYMAPEQLSGGDVTPRTDLYALGMILYEMYTAKRFERGRSQSLSTDTKDVDPAVQRVILRCLEEKPESRPASIHSIIAALPGGDPLQAALDAGETPSPEMVVAAGETGELRASRGLALFIAMILLVITNAIVSKKAMLFGRAEFPKKPEILAERSREILASAGYTRAPGGVAYNLGWDNDYFDADRARREDVNTVRPSPVVFYYRESPRELLAETPELRVTQFDPPLTLSGMANVETDAAGRLIRFAVVPPELEDPPAQHHSVEWIRFINEAGIDPSSLRPVMPRWRVPVDSDEKAAWQARYPDHAEPVRVEAASYHGKPVWFSVIPSWQQPERGIEVMEGSGTRAAEVGAALVVFFAVWGSLYLARRNLRRSRGDRKGAFRLAIFLITVVFAGRLLRVDHVWSIPEENQIITQLVSEAVVAGIVAWLVYIAIEPYFRRRWPRLLIGWSRLLAGRFRDPMVGRDVLIGAVTGTAAAVIVKLTFIAPAWFGGPAWFPALPGRAFFTTLGDLRHLGFLMLSGLQQAVMIALGGAFLFLLFHFVTRSAAVATLLLIVVCGLASPGAPHRVTAFVVSLFVVFVFRRNGVLALASTFTFFFVFVSAPVTLDPSIWYFGRSFFTMALMIAVAGYAFFLSLAAQPLFKLAMLEED
jgi:predicted Ser/Thr protein kinase